MGFEGETRVGWWRSLVVRMLAVGESARWVGARRRGSGSFL